VVAVVGEPGVGKSRLYWEFTHSDSTRDCTILESGSVSYGRATSYLPIIELLKAYFRIVSADTTDGIREKVTGTLLALDRQLESCLSPILWLLDVPITDAKWERLDPPQRRQRILDGVTRLLLHESQVRPLLVVFEDLHWIDAETQSLLDGLVESLPTARVLLLVNYRPEYSHGWGSKTYYSQLRIDPLAAASADELLDALLGRDPSVAPLKRLLIERTAGNPFFLEESVRSLLETGVLAGERGAYRLVKAPDNLQIPATAQAILAARIDRLAPEDKRLLQSASVIGKDVPLALLRAVADDAEGAVHVGVVRLVAGEFLYETRRFPDLEYAFEHALTHEVAYGSVLQDRRRALHARLVGAMEHVYADRLSEQIERLAHHALRGEVWDKAVTYQRQAGTRAVARSAYREAVACFEHALDGLTRLPATPEVLEKDIELRFDVRTALLAVGEMAKSLDHLREAERRARMLDDQRRLGWVSAYLALHFWAIGRPTDASTFGRSALAIAEARGDHTLRVAAHAYLGYACFAAGDYAAAIDLLRRSVRWLEGDLSRERFGNVPFPAASVPSFLALALAERGEFAEGVAEGQAAIRVAEALEHPYSLVLVWSNVAALYSIKGDLGQATRLLERALALSREALLPTMSLYVMAVLTHVYALSGRADEGMAMGLATLTGAATMGLQTHSALALVRLGDACLLAGRPDPALAFAGQALTLARDLGQRGGEAWALRLLGEIVSCSDPPDVESAEGHFGEALALADQLGMRPLVAHCHLSLGRLASRSGKRPLARQHLARAAAMYREMDMSFWLEKAEAALG
jgi:tetratricopeptide (TPR) repeat protein